MQILRAEQLRCFEQPTVVTVGSFDGVHRGHQALLHVARKEADRIGGAVVVVSFDPHPRIALGRTEGFSLLTEQNEKEARLAQHGVDYLVIMPFNAETAREAGENFARRFLQGVLHAKIIVAGYNHRFGCDRIDPMQLTIEGLRVVQVPPVICNGEKVSSTRIRNLLAEGKTEQAAELMGL